MSIERLHAMKEAFMCAVEGQMYNLAEVDAEELGEVVDIIKDLEETIYYCTVTKAMEEGSGQYQEKEKMYYIPMHGRYDEDWRHDRMYYGENPNSSSSHNGNMTNGEGGNGRHYTEREYPHAFMDSREGKSYRSRRMYMEAKESKQDKASQMRELEKYMQELTQDIVEMIEGSSTEERQYLSKKVSALATKISQTND